MGKQIKLNCIESGFEEKVIADTVSKNTFKFSTLVGYNDVQGFKIESEIEAGLTKHELVILFNDHCKMIVEELNKLEETKDTEDKE